MMIVFSVMLGATGQITMKHGMNQVGRINAAEAVSKIFGAFGNPFVLAGFAMYGISALVWMVILSRVNLSYAYPLVSMGYIFVVLFSRSFFHEPVTPLRLAGTLVICVGVVLITRS